MATVVEMPRLSDTMEEGVVAKWHIKEGDKVKRGQLIAEVETDKATMEFESFDAGYVLKLVAPEGETFAIGTAIAVLGKKGESYEEALAAGSSAAEDSANSQPVAGAPSAAPVAAPAAVVAPLQTAPTPVRAGDGDRVAASPLARRLAREYGLDIGQIQGSGPHGRIVKNDVEAARGSGGGAAAASAVAVGGRTYVSRPDEALKLSPMRKTIAKRMARANAEIPQFYLTAVIEMDRAVALRKEVNAALADRGGKVSFNDLVLLACAKALVEHPAVNAYWNGTTIVRRGDVHMGMAVAVEEGLIVPVVRFADQKTLSQIAAEARDLGTRGRDKQLVPEEMSGSTFTVSNLGMFGIEEFSAVVNLGEGAILAVGSIVDVLVPRDGKPVAAKHMKITLACDHRVMDGAIGAKFLATVRGLLERPLGMLT